MGPQQDSSASVLLHAVVLFVHHVPHSPYCRHSTRKPQGMSRKWQSFVSLRCSGVCKSMHTPHAELKTLTEQQMQWQQQGRGRWIWVPLTPERSKEESWQQVGCEGVHVCKMSLNGMPSTWLSVFGHSPPRQAWIKNILGLFWRLGQFALSKSRKASCNWEKKERKFLHCKPNPASPCFPVFCLLPHQPWYLLLYLQTQWVTHTSLLHPLPRFILAWVHALYLVFIQRDNFSYLPFFISLTSHRQPLALFVPSSPYFFSILKVNPQSCIISFFFFLTLLLS